MALVCDIKSEPKDEDQNEDLEDGEIEDDDDVDVPTEPPVQERPPPCQQSPIPMVQQQLQLQQQAQQQQQQIFRMVEPSGLLKQDLKLPPMSMLSEKDRLEKPDKKRHQKKQLTEAEKSVMRLHKIERMEREKREKYRREQAMVLHPIEQEEDYAMVLEKAIAKVLKKEKPSSDGEEKEEETKRGKKRKKKEKHNKKNKKNKQQQQQLQLESPKLEEFDESEMLNMRGGSPDLKDHPSPVLPGLAAPGIKTDEDSYDSETSSSKSGSEGRRERRKHRGKRQFEHGKHGERKYRERSRERSREREKRAKAAKRNNGICLYYLQGMCEDNNCPYSHETVQPLKLELCKFYLLDCCAKGDKCLYMHSDFPCKFYHTGIPCPHNENCKFAHGGPLSDNLKQILFKHIETAPKEILGNFPRLSRDNASVMIIQAQKQLETKYGPPKKDREQQQMENGSSKGDIPSLFDLNFPNPSEGQGGESSDGSVKKENKRNRPSRWQDPEPLEKSADKGKAPFGIKGGFKDQDMRINSNGDVDMRTLNMQPTIHTTNIVNPNILAQKPPQMIAPPPNLMLPFVQAQLPGLLQQSGTPLQNVLQSAVNMLNPGLLAQSMAEAVDIEKYKMEAAGHKDADMIEASKMDTDIRQLDLGLLRQDTDIRSFNKNQSPTDEDEENNLQIVMDEEEQKEESPTPSYLDTLPKTQRDLFKRIQAQQKEATIQDTAHSSDNENDANIDWYSDDEDDNKLTIEETKHEDEKEIEPAPVKPLEFVEQLGDLSKIDISAEVTKLLTTISKQSSAFVERKETKEVKDPRQQDVKSLGSPRDPRQGDRDPRRRLSSVEEKPVSIYEQGSITDVSKDIDLRSADRTFGDTDLRGRPDVDLRQLGLPFKGMQNYTPATEIDASINSHVPITWKVYIVEIPKPDYTGLKLSATEAQTTGDPRLRKIFRLSTEEKDSPASPKESPKMSAPTVRVDPRRKKLEAEQQQKPTETNMTYTQQLAMLQSSPFYGTLTSNQKVMLNQELARRNDQSGQSDPIIGAMLQNLGLISSQANTGGQSQALNILANVNNIGFPPPGMPQNMGPGLLGPAPPVQNFPMNFDPRNEGLLGNGPPFGFQEGNNFGGFNEDFYPPDGGNFNNGNQGNNNRDNMRGFRDRPRRGRNANNNRNNRNFFRRHNRNRNNSPP